MTPPLSSDIQKLLSACHHDPFAVLGRHVNGKNCMVRVLLPHAEQVRFLHAPLSLQRIGNTDIFEWHGQATEVPDNYQIQWSDQYGIHQRYDPYCFPPQLTEFDLHLFNEGKHRHAYQFLGAHQHQINTIDGILFAVWAPNAERVSVVGEFNQWDGRIHPMRVRGSSGVWELFIPNLATCNLYKFEIRQRATGNIFIKSDPYAQGCENRPHTANYVVPNSQHEWQDANWLANRAQSQWSHRPMSIYEVHLGSWQRNEAGKFLNYRELAHRLVAYIERLGFTHIELLPIAEHPYDPSWGYQVTGFYAPTSRFGSPDDFRYFIDYCHQHNIGVLLDWVPGHFPKDAHGLARFDGTALYEHPDPRKGEHKEWGTYVFNYARLEVRSFLISNALYWLKIFHIDGLRVDAVASMLYLDYSRKAGEWLPNQYGGHENIEAISFLQELNSVVQAECAGSLMIAEESTSWAQVTRPSSNGLGFSMKWNMGWMHDTAIYFREDQQHRRYHHQLLTFGMLYAFSENFVLPFSHDEVVHGKGSLLNKMPGDTWQKFANLRLLFTYLWTYSGKKLLFMGCEFGQEREWSEERALDWELLDKPNHQGIQNIVKDLNQLYCQQPALHQFDFEGQGFTWIDCSDNKQSVIAFKRRAGAEELLILFNFTATPRYNYRIGVQQLGVYHEIFNSDSYHYQGSNMGNDAITADNQTWKEYPYSVSLTLPPLAGIILQLKTS
ncbi:1,4-alpha-glucan branching protein GlgB [Beggiatoa leptomitoformis]|uniref:1,4-alpha-glucan branching enzyme GlgB n=1 Tax=Beggiatoa leptomitoformis TaxID=288004 RepID=A0A2N9YFA1_9GAMM|nr:1,4-alpha-glucan branching protein GlgB [Beggiatoa leptomitoformis]ALG68519.1 1,4-alpha-glucan branching protein GlgB [Beggiatoa leptomitoformis]AUI69140.1 1,4-alpha-glucan branching protein GlgB [Beggiatoa leptomitoformis]